MPGERVGSARRKVDLVLTAVRYRDSDHTMELARGYERLGSVWSDLVLYDRPRLVEIVRAGRRVVVGEAKRLPGDFEIRAAVRINTTGGEAVLAVNTSSRDGDELDLPLF